MPFVAFTLALAFPPFVACTLALAFPFLPPLCEVAGVKRFEDQGG